MSDLTKLTLADAVDGLKAKTFSSEELTKAFLGEIATLQGSGRLEVRGRVSLHAVVQMTLCAIPAEDPRRHILDQLEESTFGHAFRQAGPRSSGGFSPEKSRRDWSKTHDGVVSLVDELYFNGKTVFVDHGQGFVSMVCHLDQARVEVGQKVARGERLGDAGSSGRATGPHLHWSVYLNGAAVDPALFIAPPKAR